MEACYCPALHRMVPCSQCDDPKCYDNLVNFMASTDGLEVEADQDRLINELDKYNT